MNLIEIFVGVIGREHELPKTDAVGSSPVDPRRPVIDGLQSINPQLNTAGGRVTCSTNLDAAGEFHPLIGDIMNTSRIERR